MSYEMAVPIISVLLGLVLVLFNKQMAKIQKRGAEGKTDMVSKRMNKYTFKDIRLLSGFVGIVFILFGVIGIIQAF